MWLQIFHLWEQAALVVLPSSAFSPVSANLVNGREWTNVSKVCPLET